ncbi:hypothetical protein B0T19DRAFT_484453 [Cercophora scortea]|uniref:Protein SSH4 n=1 Tax=Cercophora scortea TaxID=314031 RepID=A0AAE0ILJ6_9PEZI|nr:hypothetical protein B0T19DRAFT_484453 [Cercophora scortea]
MATPFQHGGSSGYIGDSIAPTGIPATAGQRRSSYASVVSGAAALPRPQRAGAVSHLLNPSNDSDMSSLYYNSVFAGTRSSRFNVAARAGVDSSGDENGHPWPPRLGANFPWFSRAYDLYMYGDGSSFGAGSDDGFGNPTPNSSLNFLSPSYLRGSVYLQKLEDAHKRRLLAEREGHIAKTQAGAGLSSSGNTHILQTSKLPPGSHRGVAFELVEKPLTPEDDDVTTPLPSRWNKDDKDAVLEVIGDGFEVKYTGRSSSDHEACAIRADHYMSSQCGVYYFEITILNKRKEDTTIGIGFSGRSVALQRAPGWEPESWGYHGDDGHCFASQNVGKSYGPKFGPGDTVGCLLNFRLGQALFTKNGVQLEVAFRDVAFKDPKTRLYPTVGLKKPGDHVLANFGQVPFQFDIDGYMKRQQKMISEGIKSADTSKLAPPLNETELIQQLVLQFLRHDGYVETARAFAEEIHAEKRALSLDPADAIEGINIKDDEDANNRQSIRRAILEGDIDQALEYTRTYYPSVLTDNEQVYFRLRCRKFIEMIRKEAELNLLLEKKGLSRSFRPSAGEDDEEMFEAGVGGGNGEDEMDTEGGVDMAGVSKLSQEALAYGQELRMEFRNDPRREVSKHLDEIFTLIAYSNPLRVKEVAHLLDRAGRAAVAEELNSAILMSLGKSSRAALENMYAQTCVLLEDLREGGGDGAFVTVQGIIDEIPTPTLV